MGNTTEKQHISRFHGGFVDLWQVDTRVQIPWDRVVRLVTSRDADKTTAALVKTGGFILQRPGDVHLFNELSAIKLGITTRILPVQ